MAHGSAALAIAPGNGGTRTGVKSDSPDTTDFCEDFAMTRARLSSARVAFTFSSRGGKPWNTEDIMTTPRNHDRRLICYHRWLREMARIREVALRATRRQPRQEQFRCVHSG